MGILYITEYGALTQLVGDAGQMPDENTLMAEQAITFGVNTVSAALNTGTRYVRLHVDGTSPAAIKFGYGSVTTPPTPVAANGTQQRFAANQTEYKGVPTNGSKATDGSLIQVKIAAITAT